MPVMPRPGIKHPGRCRPQDLSQAVGAVGRLYIVDISEITQRHGPAEKVILAREHPLGGVPHTTRDAMRRSSGLMATA